MWGRLTKLRVCEESGVSGSYEIRRRESERGSQHVLVRARTVIRIVATPFAQILSAIAAVRILTKKEKERMLLLFFFGATATTSDRGRARIFFVEKKKKK